MRGTKKSPYTNAIGIVFIIIPAIIFTAQFFTELLLPVDNAILGGITGIGLVVWLGLSDKLFASIIEKYFGKKK